MGAHQETSLCPCPHRALPERGSLAGDRLSLPPQCGWRLVPVWSIHHQHHSRAGPLRGHAGACHQPGLPGDHGGRLIPHLPQLRGGVQPHDGPGLPERLLVPWYPGAGTGKRQCIGDLQSPPGPITWRHHIERRAQELLEAAQPHNCSHGAGRTRGPRVLPPHLWWLPMTTVPSPDGLCFSTARAADAKEPNATELCRSLAPAAFSRFYHPFRMGGSVLCVTNCTPNVPGTIDCGPGLCRVTTDGPQCFCPAVSWFLTSGGRCQTHISQVGLGLGVGLGLLVLLLLCIGFSICLAKEKKASTGDSISIEDNPRRNPRATGIYHVNSRRSPAPKDPYGHSSYRPNMDVAAPTTPVLVEEPPSL
ncbi:uncharacterized protein ACIB01_019036 [Guaruba guarouba]